MDNKITTVILIRHGERHEPQPGEPSLPGPHLNDAGKARAQRLIHVLGVAGVLAVYVSPFARTAETAQPLATHLGLQMTQVGKPADLANHIVTNHKGGTVLIVGHSDSVPALIKQLGGGDIPIIDDRVFDDLFVVTIYAIGKAKTIKLKYGDPS